MLGKLLKYEIKATARIFLPLYGLIMLLAILNRIFFSLPMNQGYFNVPRIISMTVYVILIVALFVMTLVVIIQRFYKNLLGDEGYLSFTLPVKTHLHIDAKVITTVMWLAASVVVSALSVLVILQYSDAARVLNQFSGFIGDFCSRYGGMAYLLILEFILLLIVSILDATVKIYAAITIGNLAGKHKLLAGFGAYIGFGVIEQIIGSIITSVYGERIRELFGPVGSGVTLAPPLWPIAVAGLCLILFCLLFTAAYYILTNWLLARKLNLE